MVKTTAEIIEHLKRDQQARDSTILASLVNSVLKCGDKSDADRLLPQFLSDPQDFHHALVLPVFKKFGDRHHARALFEACIGSGKFDPQTDAEILEVLGSLQFEPVKQLLVNYAFVETDYYLSRHAVLGLLHFDCGELQDTITGEIEKCYGRNLFPEFVPALVCKLRDKTATLEKLYELGNTTASTDCNAGIILGFALSGKEGEWYFRQALFDPAWELFSGATGSVYQAYRGLHFLGITFRELHQHLKQISDPQTLDYALTMLLSLLEMKIMDRENTGPESFADLYQSLFKWTEKKDNLIDLCQKANPTRAFGFANKEEDAYRLEKLVGLKMDEENILKNFAGQPVNFSPGIE